MVLVRSPVSGSEQQVRSELHALRTLVQTVADEQAGTIAKLASMYVETLRGGGILWFAGNGGSAADAQHIATEYVIRFRRNRAALPAIAITTDTSLLTACGNDIAFEDIFARQIEALVRPTDLVILHSTSGSSPNIVRAAEQARAKGAKTVALLGRGGGPVKDLVDACLVVPSDDTSHIQELHLAIEHIICGLVESTLHP